MITTALGGRSGLFLCVSRDLIFRLLSFPVSLYTSCYRLSITAKVLLLSGKVV